MRALIPVVVSVFAAASILGPDFIESLSAALFPPHPRWLPAALAMGLLWVCCHEAGRRLALPSGAWLLHLPADGTAHRRSAAAGVVFSVVPIWLLLAALAAVTATSRGVVLSRLAGISVALLGAALASLPVRRRPLALALGTVGGTLGLLGPHLFLAVGAAVVGLGDLAAGDLLAPKRSSTAIAGASRGLKGRSALFELPRRIAFRALGPARLLEVELWGLLPLGMGVVFLANNPIERGLAGGAGRLAIGAAIVLVLARSIDHLTRLRPEWAFARSLPWSARNRILADAGLFTLIALPVTIVGCLLFPASALPVALAIPWLIARACAYLRATQRSPSALFLLEGLLAVGSITLAPALCVLLLLSTPWFLNLAARVERDRRVVVWSELAHEPGGDTAGGRSA